MNIKKIALCSLLAATMAPQTTNCIDQNTLNDLKNRYNHTIWYEIDKAAQILKLQMLLKDVEKEESLLPGTGYDLTGLAYSVLCAANGSAPLILTDYLINTSTLDTTSKYAALATGVTFCALNTCACFSAAINALNKGEQIARREKDLQLLKSHIISTLKSL